MSKFDKMRDRHIELYGNLAKGHDPSCADVKTLIEDGLRDSEFIPYIEERNELRHILQFWGGYLSSKNGRFPDIDIDAQGRRPGIIIARGPERKEPKSAPKYSEVEEAPASSRRRFEIASEIVRKQVSVSAMSAADISISLRQVFKTLTELQNAESGEIELPTPQRSAPTVGTPKPLAIKDSIQENKVICLECGAEMRQLTGKHLVSHGMSPNEYKRKYGFSLRTPLSAKSLTKARSKGAKKRGLPENLVKWLESKRQKNAKRRLPPNLLPL